MEFVNMALIQLFQGFDKWRLTDALMGGSVASKETYSDYTSDWYMNIGVSICVFIFISTFFTNFLDLMVYIKIAIKRFRDRSFVNRMKNDPEDPEDDAPNSKIKIQSDIETLYKGKEFRGEQAYARMMSILFVI
jgi:hypothetical protein